MTCPIVFASDAAYAMPLATALRSLVDSNRAAWPLDVHILHDGIPQALRRRIEGSLPARSANLSWPQANLDRFGAMLTAPGISKMTFARFLIPELFDDSVERVLYIDSDTLTLGDLGPLLTADLAGATFGAVHDEIDQLIKQGHPRYAQVPRVANYFNAGMLLIDLPKWRSSAMSERAYRYLEAHPTTPFADQDALNVAGDKDWHALASQWNFQKHFETRIDAMSPAARPRIVHFVTSSKPWRANSLSVNARLYDRFRSRTEFARSVHERCADAFVAATSRLNLRLSRFSWWRRTRPQLRFKAGAPGAGSS